MSEPGPDYDVAILGGGPSGCSAAIELARNGKRVIVLERSSYDDVRVGETLAPQAMLWLRRLGIPAALGSVPHVPAPSVVRLWEAPVALADRMSFEDAGHGWHIDRPRFDALLADTAERAGGTVHRGAVVRGCTQHGDDGWGVAFDHDGRRSHVHAPWVIDATGRKSWFSRRQGVVPRAVDRLIGLLGYGPARATGDHDLVVEATPNGWWYSAPLPGGGSVAAFMTDSDLIQRGERDLESYWEAQREQSALISRLHCATITLRSVVARTTRSDAVTGKRWLAVGDAAMSFDPLFGLGICQALASGWTCARSLLGASVSDARAIGAYQSWSAARYRDYLGRRTRVYGSVKRWPGSPFWQRRASQTIGVHDTVCDR